MSLPLEDKVWTYEDYCQLPDDGIRYEVLEGALFMTRAPTPYHQILSHRLQFLFYERTRSEGGLILDAPVDLLMEGASPAQPDLIYLRPGQEHLITGRGVEGVPELLCEILSPSTAARNRTLKLHRYARSGVRRYLILDPPSRTLEIFLLDGETYRLENSLGPGDSHHLDDYGVTVDMDSLFAGLPEEL